MPLFYFDVSNGSTEPDEDGIDLEGLETARKQAVRLVGELLRFDGAAVWDGDGIVVEVFDESRNPLFAVRVAGSALFPGS